MDPTKYWMLARRKLGDQKAPVFSTPHITVGGGGGGGGGSSASYYESWEERAFAEDSAGNLGGCIWPPRSYSCSFCGREFRSAQALGGHMNVHRRDRARLKLSGVVEEGGGEEHGMPPHQSYMIQPCPPQIGALQQAYGPNPSASGVDTNPNSSICSVLAYPARSLVQAATARTVWGKSVLTAPLVSPSDERQYGKREMLLRAAQLVAQDHLKPAARMRSNQELHAGTGDQLNLSVLGCRKRRNFDDERTDDEHVIHLCRKRRRIDLEVTPLEVSSSQNQQQDGADDGDDTRRAKVLKLCPSSPVEELDLELRL